MQFKEYRFSDLLKAIVDNRGKTCPVQEQGMPLIATNCIKNESLYPVFEKLRYVSDETYLNWFRAHPEPSDIIFVCKGSPGRVAWTPKPVTFCIAQDMVAIRADETKVDPKYLFALLRSQETQNKILNMHVGSLIPHFKKGDFKNFYLSVPEDMDYQKKVGEIYFKFCEKVEVNTQTSQTLESFAQAIFKSWFVDFDPVKAKIETLAAGGSADDAELAAMRVISAKTVDELNSLKASNPEAFNKLAQTAALFPDAMQDSELGEIPEGWEVKQLSEICQVINGRAYKNTEFKTEGTPIVRIQNLSNGGKTVYSDLELPPEKYIDREDFIYAWSATFGPHIWRGPKSIYHYHIWKMEVDESVISRYFLYLSMFRKTEAMKNAGTGSIFTHLTKKIMESQHVLIGDHAINKKFSDIIVPIFDQISSLKNESTHLADIRDALLPKLLTGDGLTSEVANV